MSKSDESDQSRINLKDDKDLIDQKIKKAKTDSDPIPSEINGLKNRKEALNLISIYASINNISVSNVLKDFSGKNFSTFKSKLAESLIERICPIGKEINQLLKDKKHLDEILKKGSQKAGIIANKNLKEIYVGPLEFTKKDENSKVPLVNKILSIEGTVMVFFGQDFITVKKEKNLKWEDLKHGIISEINDYYSQGNEVVFKKDPSKTVSRTEIKNSNNVINKINEVLDTKVRPAVAKDGGDITFKSFKDGVVTVELKGSCSGCPSSIMTLKQGVQNLLCHYIPEVKSVEAN